MSCHCNERCFIYVFSVICGLGTTIGLIILFVWITPNEENFPCQMTNVTFSIQYSCTNTCFGCLNVTNVTATELCSSFTYLNSQSLINDISYYTAASYFNNDQYMLNYTCNNQVYCCSQVCATCQSCQRHNCQDYQCNCVCISYIPDQLCEYVCVPEVTVTFTLLMDISSLTILKRQGFDTEIVNTLQANSKNIEDFVKYQDYTNANCHSENLPTIDSWSFSS